MLHYESYSGEDFVRKWSALVASGRAPVFRPARGGTAAALRALIGRELDEETARRSLMRLFERTTQDDLETLRDLGLLVEADPSKGTHRPADFPPGGDEEFLAALHELRAQPKRQFHPPSREPGEGRIRAVRSLLRRS